MRLCDCKCGKPTKVAKRTDRRWGRVKGKGARFLPGHHVRVRPREGTRGWHEPSYYERREASV